MAKRESVARYPFSAASSLSEACEDAAEQLLSDVSYIHLSVTRPFGERSGLISPELLDSAVHRPFFILGGDFAYPTGLEQAAALFESLVMNHVFDDGNKRTAITACLFFLDRCGYWRNSPFLSDKERTELEALTLRIANENALLQNGTLDAPLGVPGVANELSRILQASKRRRIRISRLLSRAFRPISNLFQTSDD